MRIAECGTRSENLSPVFCTLDGPRIRRGDPARGIHQHLHLGARPTGDVNLDPSAIGGAGTGPGLPGTTGPGTWVETRFDLLVAALFSWTLLSAVTGRWRAACLATPWPRATIRPPWPSWPPGRG